MEETVKQGGEQIATMVIINGVNKANDIQCNEQTVMLSATQNRITPTYIANEAKAKAFSDCVCLLLDQQPH